MKQKHLIFVFEQFYVKLLNAEEILKKKKNIREKEEEEVYLINRHLISK